MRNAQETDLIKIHIFLFFHYFVFKAIVTKSLINFFLNKINYFIIIIKAIINLFYINLYGIPKKIRTNVKRTINMLIK